MESLLKSVTRIVVLQDDILITGRDTIEHLHNLEEVLSHLDRVGLRLKCSKCVFLALEVEFWERKVAADGIRPMDSKTEAIKNASRPQNVMELCSFLGLFNYFETGLNLNVMAYLLESLADFVQEPADRIEDFEDLGIKLCGHEYNSVQRHVWVRNRRYDNVGSLCMKHKNYLFVRQPYKANVATEASKRRCTLDDVTTWVALAGTAMPLGASVKEPTEFLTRRRRRLPSKVRLQPYVINEQTQVKFFTPTIGTLISEKVTVFASHMGRKGPRRAWHNLRSENKRGRLKQSKLSLEAVPDPFLVTMHIITNPGNSAALQSAIDSLTTWINPDLRLFIASERGSSQPLRTGSGGIVVQPALAVIIFVHEECGQQISQLHERFLHPPWQYHHTERVKGSILPYMPRNQDFFTLANHAALWAIRQVHYGKEIIRFTIYCSFDNFVDTVRMYQLILRREASKRKPDFVFFTVYSNMDVDIQLSLKRLPKGQCPTPTESAVLEFRVHNIGHLVPLLPNPCSPISDVRWQTEDYDGNKLLLQVRGLSRSSWRRSVVPQFVTARSTSSIPPRCFLPQCLGYAPDRYRRRRQINHKPQHTSGFSQFRGSSQEDIWIGCQGDAGRTARSASGNSRVAQRSKSLFCLPTFSSSASSSSSPLGDLALSPRHRGQKIRIPALGVTSGIAVHGLEDAAETDVDTGLTTSCSDLSGLSTHSTLNGFGKDLDAALPSLGKCRSKPKPDLFRPLSSMDDSLPSFCQLPSSSFPQFPQFSSCCRISRTPSPRAFTATPWLCSRAKQSSSLERKRETENENRPEGQQPTAPQEGEQEFYI
uniref:protein FAM124A n=1 Tax=Pristiophorus japonicus TaxID=55135 RepID=UPI00398E854B